MGNPGLRDGQHGSKSSRPCWGGARSLHRSAAPCALWVALVLFWVAVGFGVLLSPLKLNQYSVSTYVLALLLAFVVCCLGQRHQLRLRPLPTSAIVGAANGVLVAVVLAGIGLAYFRLEQTSDYAAYLQHAYEIQSEGSYEVRGMYAWRPPGMALALLVPLWLGFSDLAAVWLVNALSMILIWIVVRRALAGRTGTRLMVVYVGAIVAMALFPFLMIPASELPAMAFTLASVAILGQYTREIQGLRMSRSLAAGMMVGIAALFRPLVLLQIPVMAWGIWTAKGFGESKVERFKRRVGRAALLLVGCGLAIAPWTIRNWVVLGALVPISTNGGEVFYSANAPVDFRKQGRYNVELYEELRRDVPDEVERNSEGFRRGLCSIIADPGAFLKSLPLRAGRIFVNAPVWAANYVASHQERIPSGILGSVLGLAAFAGFWQLWVRIVSLRHVLWNSLRRLEIVPWPHVCVIVVFAAEILFETRGRYFMSLLPYILIIWLCGEAASLGDRQGRSRQRQR